MDVIRAEKLCKRYPKCSADAVHDVSFTIREGELVSVIGTNGAGKSTLIEMIVGQKRPTSGELEVLGLSPGTDMRRLSGKIAFLPQSASLFDRLTVKENLEYFITLNGNVRTLDEVIGIFSLEKLIDKRYDTLSGGQGQRVCLACLLTGRPELVILDEPATGFDPETREEIWCIFEDIRDTGTTVVLTTHNVSEARMHSDRIIVMKDGRIDFNGAPSEMNAHIKVTVNDPDSKIFSSFGGERKGNRTELSAAGSKELSELLLTLQREGIDPEDIVVGGVDDVLQ